MDQIEGHEADEWNLKKAKQNSVQGNSILATTDNRNWIYCPA